MYYLIFWKYTFFQKHFQALYIGLLQFGLFCILDSYESIAELDEYIKVDEEKAEVPPPPRKSTQSCPSVDEDYDDIGEADEDGEDYDDVG